MASDSDSDIPLGQRATQSQKPTQDREPEPLKPPANDTASTPADEGSSDDEAIGEKFAATKIAHGALT